EGGGSLHRPCSQRRKGGGPAGSAVHQTRTGDQSEYRENPRPRRATHAARPRRRGHRIDWSLLHCMSPVVALRGLREMSPRLSAFGAKRTYPSIRAHSLRPLMTDAVEKVVNDLTKPF